MSRLGRSARAIGLELPLEGEELLDVIEKRHAPWART